MAGSTARATRYRQRCYPKQSTITASHLIWLPLKPGRQTQWSPEARRLIYLRASTIASIFWQHHPTETDPRGSRSADAVALNIQDWGGFIGQWDTRIWKTSPRRDCAISANYSVCPPADEQEREQRPVSPRYPEDYVGLQAGYVKPANLAWYASHHHTSEGLNEPYQYSYLFGYSMELSENERTLVLPNDEKIRILAISVAKEDTDVKSAQPLYDTLGRGEATSQQK
jgi:hypothetical protein